MDLEEPITQQETEAQAKLQEILGQKNKKFMDGFILVSAKRRKKDLSGATASEAMEAVAAAAALAEAAAKAAKEVFDKAAAAEKAKQ